MAGVERRRGLLHVGPSWEESSRRQEEALKMGEERVASEMRSWREQEKEFGAEYGENLCVLTVSFINRSKSNPQITHLEGKNVAVGEMIDSYAGLLVDSIQQQPEETRGEWLTGYLRAAEGLRR